MNYLREVLCLERSSADKSAVDIAHCHKLGRVLCVHASAVLDANGVGNILAVLALDGLALFATVGQPVKETSSPIIAHREIRDLNSFKFLLS